MDTKSTVASSAACGAQLPLGVSARRRLRGVMALRSLPILLSVGLRAFDVVELAVVTLSAVSSSPDETSMNWASQGAVWAMSSSRRPRHAGQSSSSLRIRRRLVQSRDSPDRGFWRVPTRTRWHLKMWVWGYDGEAAIRSGCRAGGARVLHGCSRRMPADLSMGGMLGCSWMPMAAVSWHSVAGGELMALDRQGRKRGILTSEGGIQK